MPHIEDFAFRSVLAK